MADIFIPMALFGAFVLVVGQLARLGSNLSLNRTLREALRSDPASVPVLAERLDARQPWADALIGWVFIAFAIGLVLMALFEPNVGDRRETVQAAIVPLVVGVVVLWYVRMARKAAADDMARPPRTARVAREPAAAAAPQARRAPVRRVKSPG